MRRIDNRKQSWLFNISTASRVHIILKGGFYEKEQEKTASHHSLIGYGGNFNDGRCHRLRGGSPYSATYAETVEAFTEQNATYDAMPAAPMMARDGLWEQELAEEDVALTEPQEDYGASDLTASAGAGAQTPVSANRKLIRTIHLHVETTEFDNLLASISQSTTEMGGYIEQSDISGSSISSTQPGGRYAFLTVRVPSDHLDSFLSQVSEQSNVTNRSENIEDVTLQYSDIESRKKTLTVEQERLWALLEKADTLEAVIALEERLSEIRYELESFESRLRLYDNQIDYSTVHINLDEVRVFTPTTPDSIATRIQKDLAGIWKA